MIGVDRIIIADDCSTDITPNVLQEFADQKLITYLKSQHLKYLNCSAFNPDELSHFRYLFHFARRKCDWVTIIDADEYIFPVVEPKSVRFLPLMLTNQSLIRMPWFIMSTHGKEVRTSGLIIERFTTGLINQHIKTFARTSIISDWRKSHYPVFKIKEMKFGEHPFAYKWEMNMSVPCPLPRHSPIYLRHFQGLSWEEYLETRGSRNRTSANEDNPW